MNNPLSSNQFLRTSQIYDCLRRVSTTRIWAYSPELERLNKHFRTLKSALGENGDDEYWAMFNWRIRRYQFVVSCVPLAPSHPSFNGLATRETLISRSSGCAQSYPAHTDQVRDLVNAFEAVFQTTENHLLQAVIDQGVENSTGTVVVIRDGQFVDVVQQELLRNEATNRMRVMSPKQISIGDSNKSIVVCGARRWYPEYLFTVPRGERVYLTCYNWLSDRWSTQHAFLKAETCAYRSTAMARNDFDKEPVSYDEIDEADEIIAEIDVSRLVGLGSLRDESTEGEQVDAILVLLEGETAVFIEASEDSKTMTINVDLPETGGDRTRFRRIRNVDIQVGACVILRTKGGGDYLRPVADRFLGQHAQRVRSSQHEWKYRLNALVRTEGILPTSIALLDKGSFRADENNLRTWMSDTNIRPQDFRDFDAIMKLIGMGNRALEYWSNAELIRSAHMKAGMHIRRLLLRVVAAADLNTLERTGRMEFELSGSDAGSLTAFRVRSISTRRFKVPSSRIAEPFELLKMLETS